MGKYSFVIALLFGFVSPALARDDGRYADHPLKYWFDHLSSSRGMCCSFADGFSVSEVDWDREGGHYRVRLHGEWIDVPDIAVVAEPNRYGQSSGPTWTRTVKPTFDASCLEPVCEACAGQLQAYLVSATETSGTQCATPNCRRRGSRISSGSERFEMCLRYAGRALIVFARCLAAWAVGRAE